MAITNAPAMPQLQTIFIKCEKKKKFIIPQTQIERKIFKRSRNSNHFCGILKLLGRQSLQPMGFVKRKESFKIVRLIVRVNE